MSEYVIRLPDVGEGVAEAEIVEWHVNVGDSVSEDDVLAEVMTDKATVELPSPVHGVVRWLGAEVGDIVAVGSDIVRIETDTPAEPDAPSPPAEVSESPTLGETDHQRGHLSQELAETTTDGARAGVVTAAPAVRARAARLDIDLADVPGSGPEGRVVHEDLDRLLARQPAAAPVTRHGGDEVEEVKVVGLRRNIAERMQASKRRIPHFTYVEEVDVTALEELRGELNDGDRPRLSVLPFLMRAVVLAIRDHPEMNARFDDEAGVVKRHRAVHLGIAVQTSRGLMVPVVEDADIRDLWSSAAEVARLSEAARTAKVTLEELSGSTITITSLGALGGIVTTPVINAPEVAIIGVNKIATRPVFRDGAFVPREVMNLSSSFDHRVVDGADAAAFVQRIRALLEQPALLFMTWSAMQLASDRRYDIPATPQVVWSRLASTDEYRLWWPWLREFEATGLHAGEEWRCRVRPPLPYTVHFTIVLDEVDEPRTIGARIDGDIAGTARVTLSGRESGCEIRLTSRLSPRGRAVRIMADLARPLARRGHDWVLDTGARQFAAAVHGPS